MKKLILLALVFVICGCSAPTPTRIYTNDKVYYIEKATFIIDSCEYILGDKEYTHKGNCKYCNERRKKEQEELINKLKEQ